ncbi:MAG: TRAP transporter small permease [Pseudomonadota bacterium]|nr:TRAP transporter small permease [Pseudomonadota bacterium]
MSKRSYRWEDWVGAAVLAALALITFANVLVRYFTNQSFAWTEEISVSLMVVLTLVAGSAAVVRDRHIRVEIVFQGGSKARQRWLGLLSAFATIVAFAILSVLGGRFAWDDYQYEVTSPGIGVPQWWYSVMLPLLCIVITWRAAQRFIAVWKDR